jgi:hypothetical protein
MGDAEPVGSHCPEHAHRVVSNIQIQTRDLCLCTAEVATEMSRVLARVLKGFLPVFSTAFECF